MTASILDQGGEMIVWTGWGILGLPMFALGALGGTALGTALGLGPGSLDTGAPSNPGTVGGLLVAAVATWFVGQRLNRPRSMFDPRHGRPVLVANRHRLMFVPLQYVGVVGGLAALGIAVSLAVA